jgi:hypothetical protein
MIRLFLSASIPLPDRNPRYFETADVLAIRDSVKALVSTALGEGIIVFGGHPAITPLIALLISGMPAEAKGRVVLYQSSFFESDFIDQNDEFIDRRLTPNLGNRDASLRRMRRDMIASEKFDAAIFIGGMEGIWDEYRQFHELHPGAACYPIASTGAAALDLYKEIGAQRRDLIYELTYPTLFRNLLKEISEHKRPRM